MYYQLSVPLMLKSFTPKIPEMDFALSPLGSGVKVFPLISGLSTTVCARKTPQNGFA